MKKHAAITLGLIMAAGTAQAGLDLNTNVAVGLNADTSLQQQFATLDTDGDGVISREEAKASSKLNSEFGTLDKDANDKLTASEFNAGLKAQGEGVLSKTGDALGNAATSVGAGLSAGAHKTGEVASTVAAKTKAGAKAGAHKTRELVGTAANKTKAGVSAGVDAVGDAAAGVQVNLSTALSTRFNGLDANNDGVLSKKEVKADAGINSQFAGADENGDGQLSKAEFKAAVDASANTQ